MDTREIPRLTPPQRDVLYALAHAATLARKDPTRERAVRASDKTSVRWPHNLTVHSRAARACEKAGLVKSEYHRRYDDVHDEYFRLTDEGTAWLTDQPPPMGWTPPYDADIAAGRAARAAI